MAADPHTPAPSTASGAGLSELAARTKAANEARSTPDYVTMAKEAQAEQRAAVSQAIAELNRTVEKDGHYHPVAAALSAGHSVAAGHMNFALDWLERRALAATRTDAAAVWENINMADIGFECCLSNPSPGHVLAACNATARRRMAALPSAAQPLELKLREAADLVVRGWGAGRIAPSDDEEDVPEGDIALGNLADALKVYDRERDLGPATREQVVEALQEALEPLSGLPFDMAGERHFAAVEKLEALRYRLSLPSAAVEAGGEGMRDAGGAWDGNEVWEMLFGTLKGDVPDGLDEAACAKVATWLNRRSATGLDAIGRLERERPDDFWVIAKGRTRADEPLYGVQIMDGASSDVEEEAEAETLAEAVDDVLAKLGAALTSPQPAKEPGAAGAGLTAEELAVLHWHADAMENTATPAGGRIGPLLHRLIAAQRHPASGRGGEAGDAALREGERVQISFVGIVDRDGDVRVADTECFIMKDDLPYVLVEPVALAPPDAPPRAEGVTHDFGPPDPDAWKMYAGPASPPAPVAQAEEALGALAPEELDTIEEAARCAYSGEGVQHIDPQTVLRLIAAARASRVAGAEGALRKIADRIERGAGWEPDEPITDLAAFAVWVSNVCTEALARPDAAGTEGVR